MIEEPRVDEVIIDYTNYRGERSERRVRPVCLRYASNEWHESQWLIEAFDCEKQSFRTFAAKDIHSWRPAL